MRSALVRCLLAPAQDRRSQARRPRSWPAGSPRSSADGCSVTSTCAALRVGQPLAALAHHGHRPPQQRARGGGAQRDQRPRLHQRDLALQPVQAGRRLALRRRLVDAALAAQLELEVLDRVGDVELRRAASRARRARGRTAGRPGRRRAGRAGLPGRRAARRRTSARAPTGPSPNTDCVACSPIGHSRQRSVASLELRQRFGRVVGSGRRACMHERLRRDAARTMPARCAAPARWRGASIIRPLRAWRLAPPAARSAAASGRLCQYLRGISFCIIASFSRAGLKMCAVVGEPQRLAGIGRRRVVALRAGAELRACSPSQRTQRSGVRMAQRICVKRRTKKGATASTMWCSGSNQATCSGALAVAPASTGRKRTKAFILCMSRRTACAMCCARTHVGVERVVAQAGLVHQPPQQAVEQAEACRVAVQHDGLAQRRRRRPARIGCMRLRAAACAAAAAGVRRSANRSPSALGAACATRRSPAAPGAASSARASRRKPGQSVSLVERDGVLLRHAAI